MALLHVDVADITSRNLDDDKFVYEVSYPSDAKKGYAEFKKVDNDSLNCDILIVAVGDAAKTSVKSMILKSRKVGEFILSRQHSVALHEVKAQDKKKIVIALPSSSFDDQFSFRWVYELVDDIKPKNIVAVDSRSRSTHLGANAPVLTFYVAVEHKLTCIPELPMPLFLDGCAASALSRGQEYNIPSIGIRTYLSPVEATHVDTGVQIANAVMDALTQLGVKIDPSTMTSPEGGTAIPPSGSPREGAAAPFHTNFHKEVKTLKLASTVRTTMRMFA